MTAMATTVVGDVSFHHDAHDRTLARILTHVDIKTSGVGQDKIGSKAPPAESKADGKSLVAKEYTAFIGKCAPVIIKALGITKLFKEVRRTYWYVSGILSTSETTLKYPKSKIFSGIFNEKGGIDLFDSKLEDANFTLQNEVHLIKSYTDVLTYKLKCDYKKMTVQQERFLKGLAKLLTLYGNMALGSPEKKLMSFDEFLKQPSSQYSWN